jgi:hypothetical protein
MLSSQFKPPLQPSIYGPYSLRIATREHPTHWDTFYFDTHEERDEVAAYARYINARARADKRKRPITTAELKYLVRSVLTEDMEGKITLTSHMKMPDCHVMIERCDAH